MEDRMAVCGGHFWGGHFDILLYGFNIADHLVHQSLGCDLETVIGFSYTVVSTMGDFAYKVKDIRGLGHKLFGVVRGQEYEGVSSYIKTNFESYLPYIPVFHAAFVFAALALLVINFPAFRPEGIPQLETTDRWILWGRLWVPLFFIVPVLGLYGGGPFEG